MFSLGARTWEPGTCLQRVFVSRLGVPAAKQYQEILCPSLPPPPKPNGPSLGEPATHHPPKSPTAPHDDQELQSILVNATTALGPDAMWILFFFFCATCRRLTEHLGSQGFAAVPIRASEHGRGETQEVLPGCRFSVAFLPRFKFTGRAN